MTFIKVKLPYHFNWRNFVVIFYIFWLISVQNFINCLAIKNNKIKKGKRSASEIDPERKRIFSLMMWLVPFIILLIIELFLRIFHYGENYSLFVDYDFYGKEYRTAIRGNKLKLLILLLQQ